MYGLVIQAFTTNEINIHRRDGAMHHAITSRRAVHAAEDL
jgi:hypothetical protein